MTDHDSNFHAAGILNQKMQYVYIHIASAWVQKF